MRLWHIISRQANCKNPCDAAINQKCCALSCAIKSEKYTLIEKQIQRTNQQKYEREKKKTITPTTTTTTKFIYKTTIFRAFKHWIETKEKIKIQKYGILKFVLCMRF